MKNERKRVREREGESVKRRLMTGREGRRKVKVYVAGRKGEQEGER